MDDYQVHLHLCVGVSKLLLPPFSRRPEWKSLRQSFGESIAFAGGSQPHGRYLAADFIIWWYLMYLLVSLKSWWTQYTSIICHIFGGSTHTFFGQVYIRDFGVSMRLIWGCRCTRPTCYLWSHARLWSWKPWCGTWCRLSVGFCRGFHLWWPLSGRTKLHFLALVLLELFRPYLYQFYQVLDGSTQNAETAHIFHL